ncbi:RraA family protein [Aquicella lusitana]|uniref:Putative 4-hydroxy-4-methyl-2-oxoglutarate aldolase n=1 Tax=Aquicella lusitana TaxID=254246 RepID=A0A370G1G4_9COXI|nr:RraA family protein [Aquicella lusitana]RDI37585.1 regulator of RNase E activity RraA [Aquicella lusitana]VVC73904.1 4-hydroxy-4-methyl-2-oxoglutarate aldolase/4-carboxy-4-hydroxy-2-oxoadipate aldolase [Aquicella lusitana]
MDLLQQLYQFDTAEISDALDACGIEGALLGIKPISPGSKMVGPAFTVKYLPYEEKQAEFKSAGNYIDDVPAHAVIMIDNAGRQDCTTWGDILTQVALMRNIAGTVVFGAARDVHFIRESNYPLFASAIYMRSGKNRVYKSAQQCELTINGVRIKPGDIIMGDDNGTVVIPQAYLKEIVEKASNIKSTEQAIIASVKGGLKLEDARKLHRYDQPWLGGDKK